jgi:DNA-binding NarL/FixJ family response regulator
VDNFDAESAMKLKVLIADDHRIFRQGLRALLEKEPDLSVEVEATDGHEALEAFAQIPIDLVITDLAMPGLNGIDAARRMLAIRPNVAIIGLSMHNDRRFVVDLLKAGAKGFVSKESAFEELVQAIRAVMAGQVYLSPSVAGIVVDEYVHGNGGAEGAGAPALTHREREILQLLAEGRNTKQMAMDLHVSVKTVETHRRQIMEKLGLYSVAELTKYAIREGLTTVA